MREKHQTCFEKPMREMLSDLGFNDGVDFVFDFSMRSKYHYRIDFAFPAIKVGIECDGERWHKPNNPHDRKRDAYLKHGLGWHILRFRGDEITNHREDVKQKIKEVVEKYGMEIRK